MGRERDVLPEKRLPAFLREQVAGRRAEDHIVVCVVGHFDAVGVAGPHRDVVCRVMPRNSEGQHCRAQAVGRDDLQLRERPGRPAAAIHRFAGVGQNVQRVTHREVGIRAVGLAGVERFAAAITVLCHATEEKVGVAHIHGGSRAIHQQCAGDLAPLTVRVRGAIPGAGHRLAVGHTERQLRIPLPQIVVVEGRVPCAAAVFAGRKGLLDSGRIARPVIPGEGGDAALVQLRQIQDGAGVGCLVVAVVFLLILGWIPLAKERRPLACRHRVVDRRAACRAGRDVDRLAAGHGQRQFRPAHGGRRAAGRHFICPVALVADAHLYAVQRQGQVFQREAGLGAGGRCIAGVHLAQILHAVFDAAARQVFPAAAVVVLPDDFIFRVSLARQDGGGKIAALAHPAGDRLRRQRGVLQRIDGRGLRAQPKVLAAALRRHQAGAVRDGDGQGAQVGALAARRVVHMSLHHAGDRQVADNVFAVTVGDAAVSHSIGAVDLHPVALPAVGSAQQRRQIAHHTGHAGGLGPAGIHRVDALGLVLAQCPAVAGGGKHPPVFLRQFGGKTDAVAVGVKVAVKALDGLPVRRQRDVLRQHIAAVQRPGEPQVGVRQVGQLLGAAHFAHQLHLFIAALLALAHLALLALADVEKGVCQDVALIDSRNVLVAFGVTDLVHGQVAVGGQVKVIGAHQAVRLGIHDQPARAHAGEAVAGVVDPDGAVGDLLVRVGGGALHCFTNIERDSLPTR